MHKLGLLALSVSLFACSGDKNTDSGTVDEEQGCGNGVKNSFPVNGSADFYILDSLALTLDDEDETATLSLQDSAGADVAGDFSMDGKMLYFNPTDALSPSTSYNMVLNYCASDDAVLIPFTTSSLGTAVEEGVELVGKTYAVDLASGNFVEPPGVGSLLGGLLENNILVGIESIDTDSMSIIGALSETDSTNQDYCNQTLDNFPDADYTAAPYFAIPEGDVSLSIAGFTATIKGMALSGMFAPDGSYFGGGTLMGALDARDLAPLLFEEGLIQEATHTAVCEIVGGFGVTCAPCSDSVEACINLHVTQLTANDTGNAIGRVCEADCHELCLDDAGAAASTCDLPQPAEWPAEWEDCPVEEESDSE